MFCPKCGSDVGEGAVFCKNCGEKLVKGEAAEQTNGTSTVLTAKEAYNRLTEITGLCPKIKQVAVAENKGVKGDILKMKTAFHVYHYTPESGKAALSWSCSWRAWLALFPILMCDGLFLEFFFQGEYFPVLSILCLTACMIWFPLDLLLRKERKEVITHINSTLGCNIPLPSKVFMMIAYGLNFVEIVLCIVSFLEMADLM